MTKVQLFYMSTITPCSNDDCRIHRLTGGDLLFIRSHVGCARIHIHPLQSARCGRSASAWKQPLLPKIRFPGLVFPPIHECQESIDLSSGCQSALCSAPGMRVRHPIDAGTRDTEAGWMAPVTGEGRGHLSGKHQSSHRICRSGPSLSATAFPPLPRSPRRESATSVCFGTTKLHSRSHFVDDTPLGCCVNKLVIPIEKSAKIRDGLCRIRFFKSNGLEDVCRSRSRPDAS
jgi:hypothetical protein